jgi:hypothetical protein
MATRLPREAKWTVAHFQRATVRPVSSRKFLGRSPLANSSMSHVKNILARRLSPVPWLPRPRLRPATSKHPSLFSLKARIYYHPGLVRILMGWDGEGRRESVGQRRGTGSLRRPKAWGFPDAMLAAEHAAQYPARSVTKTIQTFTATALKKPDPHVQPLSQPLEGFEQQDSVLS